MEFDPIKSTLNLAKHGVSFTEAEELEWETAVVKPDNRHEYGEQRFIGYVLKSDRLYCVVYTERGDQRRIISLRKANEREVRAYAAEN
jgi:uncharacterized DUF497 family protein